MQAPVNVGAVPEKCHGYLSVDISRRPVTGKSSIFAMPGHITRGCFMPTSLGRCHPYMQSAHVSPALWRAVGAALDMKIPCGPSPVNEQVPGATEIRSDGTLRNHVEFMFLCIRGRHAAKKMSRSLASEALVKTDSL